MFLVGHELDNLPQPNRLFLGGRKKKTPKRRTKTNRPPRRLRPRTPWLPGTVPTCRPAHPWRPQFRGSWWLHVFFLGERVRVIHVGWEVAELTFLFEGVVLFWRSHFWVKYCWWKKSCTTSYVESLVNNRINYWPQQVSWISSRQQYHPSRFFSFPGMNFKPLWRVWKVFENCDGNLSPFGQGNFPTTHIFRFISYLSRISTRWLASCHVSRY